MTSNNKLAIMKMIKNILHISLCLYLLSCSNETVVDERSSFDDGLFLRTSYVIETVIDGNLDGVYSNDLIAEGACAGDGLNFLENQPVFNPTFSLLALYANDIGNGNFSQSINCSHFDGEFLSYTLDDRTIMFFYGEEFQFSGEVAEDGNSITFDFPNELLYGFGFFGENDIITQNNTIEEYQGGAIVTYTRQ